MNFLRERLPAPRQNQAARRARQQGGPAVANETYQPSRIAQLAQESPAWYRSGARRKLYFLLFPAAVVSYATSGYDGSMMNSLQTVSYFDDFFDNPRGAVLGLMSAIMALGSICSTPIAPWVADRFGRRWGITVGSLIMIAGAIIQCESTEFAMFVVSRFILGFGLSFATTSAPSLVSELSHPKDRVTITAICNTCTWSWRIPSLLQMAPSVVQLSAVWFLPESPRWLISKDRDHDALEALKRYHGEGEETELVRLEYEEIRTAIDNEKTRIMDTVGIKNKNTQALVNGLVNIWNFGLALTTAFFVERVGRRPLFRISTIGMLTVFIGWTIASARFAETNASSAGIAVLALIFVYQIFYCIAFSPLPVAYSVEILPFSIRAKGMATYVFSTKAAVFVNQYVNPIGLQNIGWRFYIVYVVILAVESFIAYGWFLETKGKALEEIAVIFDGEQANVRLDEGGKGDGPVDVEESEHATTKV
ncbi:hypothetical protein COL26b_009902 [Colletotrichum chrysophilum]|uniref:uncharacterized protein n=1 Tax=Colletotrichum chrysophilum TaxID=1836956 RepID=UPI002300ADF8|nr:uncharacterized protein COL26b_009902 [Colletotrichum chrysophilum]KAJ0370611.1 hypothetical protein COL26b_009902 [Colletotrichum chrysophilum]